MSLQTKPRIINRRTVLKTIGVGLAGGVVVGGGAAASNGGVNGELAKIRSATASYNDPANAEADGYLGEDEAVCGMGYHYVNMEMVDLTVDKLAPEAMVYGEDDDGNRILGAVEYIVPKAGPFAADPPSDLFEHADPEWDILDLPDPDTPLLWTLHAWVHIHNPDGVFHHHNPRKQFSPDGCQGH